VNKQRTTLPQHSADYWKISMLPYLFFLIIPIIGLFWRNDWSKFIPSLSNPQIQQAVLLSLRTTIISVFASILLGTPVAYYLSHHNYRFHRIVDTLVDLPTVLPPAVAGVALLMAFGRRGLVGAWLSQFGIELPFTETAVIMAQTFIAAPLYIKAAAIGFTDVDCELRKAAALDGANRWDVFRHIILPISRTALISGAVLTWARALGEFGATLIFAGNFPGRTQTMPLAIFIGFEIDLTQALTLSIILIIVSTITLAVVKGVLHRQVDHLRAEDWD
jgi:molybdate transport system permease protein